MMKLQLVAAAGLALSIVAHSAHAALVITEVASTSGAPAGVLNGLDWWELTNTGPGAVLLDNYAWEDGPVANDRGTFPTGVSIGASESIVIHQGTDAGIPDAFRTAWNLPAAVRVLTQAQFTGPNPFSGLSSGGDEVHLFNPSNVEAAAVTFGASTSGVTFEWARNGANLALSVAGQNGAVTSAYGGIGSPGTSVNVPEPATIALMTGAVLGVIQVARRRSIAVR